MSSPTLQDSFTEKISNSWQQTDRRRGQSLNPLWVTGEWTADVWSVQLGFATGRFNGRWRARRLCTAVVLSSSQAALGEGCISTQLPPEGPVRKCGRPSVNEGRVLVGAAAAGVALSPPSLAFSPSRRQFASSRLGEGGGGVFFITEGCHIIFWWGADSERNKFVPTVPALLSRWRCRHPIGEWLCNSVTTLTCLIIVSQKQYLKGHSDPTSSHCFSPQQPHICRDNRIVLPGMKKCNPDDVTLMTSGWVCRHIQAI